MLVPSRIVHALVFFSGLMRCEFAFQTQCRRPYESVQLKVQFVFMNIYHLIYTSITVVERLKHLTSSQISRLSNPDWIGRSKQKNLKLVKRSVRPISLKMDLRRPIKNLVIQLVRQRIQPPIEVLLYSCPRRDENKSIEESVEEN